MAGNAISLSTNQSVACAFPFEYNGTLYHACHCGGLLTGATFLDPTNDHHDMSIFTDLINFSIVFDSFLPSDAWCSLDNQVQQGAIGRCLPSTLTDVSCPRIATSGNANGGGSSSATIVAVVVSTVVGLALVAAFVLFRRRVRRAGRCVILA